MVGLSTCATGSVRGFQEAEGSMMQLPLRYPCSWNNLSIHASISKADKLPKLDMRGTVSLVHHGYPTWGEEMFIQVSHTRTVE